MTHSDENACTKGKAQTVSLGCVEADTSITAALTVITLVRLQSQLLPWLHHLSLKLLDFLSENGLGGCGRVDTAGLDGDDNVTLVLQEVVGVQSDDTGLVRLSNCEISIMRLLA